MKNAMAMTMTQKILASKAGLESVSKGDLILAELDMVLGNDITSPVAIREFYKAGFDKIFDKDKISIVLDHFTPCKDIASANLCKECREFAQKYDITNFFDTGEVGIEHVILPEKGIVAPGELIIGADSHTCTYGAIGAFSTGIGSTDMAFGMAGGKGWFKVPDAIRVEIEGEFSGKYISGKDVILHLIGKIGVDGALYKSLEFGGSGLKNLSMDDRFTIANMAIECGAKNGIFEVDEVTLNYLKDRVSREFQTFAPDKDAIYSDVIKINLGGLKPTIACPSLPENTKTVDEIAGTKVDQVVIGSCTNGRISDMAIAAEILKGRKVAKGIRVIVIPGSQEVYKECLKHGYIETFIDAGCAVSTPTCGPCLGGHMGILGDGETAISTTNRNFVGRMGAKDSKVYLASPAMAAFAALHGEITGLEKGENSNG